MIVDNRSFPPAQKLPYAYFFEGLGAAVPAELSYKRILRLAEAQ